MGYPGAEPPKAEALASLLAADQLETIVAVAEVPQGHPIALAAVQDMTEGYMTGVI